MTQCSAHEMFERLLVSKFDALNQQLATLNTTLREGAASQAQMVQGILNKQASRDDMCALRGQEIATLKAQQKAVEDRVDAVEEENDNQWTGINEAKGLSWRVRGEVAVIATLMSAIAQALLKLIHPVVLR